MKVSVYHMGKYEERGSVRCNTKNHVSVIEASVGSMDSFKTVIVRDESYTPKDGIEYMRAFIKAFSHSRAVLLSLEEGIDDTWWPQSNPKTKADIHDPIGFATLMRQLSAKTGVPVIEIEKKWHIIKQKLSKEKDEGDEDFFETVIFELLRDLGFDNDEDSESNM